LTKSFSQFDPVRHSVTILFAGSNTRTPPRRASVYDDDTCLWIINEAKV